MAQTNSLKRIEQNQLRRRTKIKRRRANSMAVKKLDARSVHIARCPEEHPKTVYSEEVAAKLAEIQRRTAERFKGRYTAEDRIICEKIADSIDRAMENFTITPYEEVMARLTEMQRKTTERFECETAGKVVEKHG